MRTSVFALGLLLISLTACVGSPTRQSTGELLDDTAIATRIKTSLIADKITKGLDIEVEVFKGRVQLTGFVGSEQEAQRAEQIALAAKGITSIDNQLAMRDGDRRFGEYIDDKVLLTRVKTALARDRQVSALAIEVEINKGVVLLGGFVNSAEQKAHATTVAQRVGGIASVQNNLQVK